MAYLIAHLKIDPQAADITPSVEAAAAALKTQNEDWTGKRHAVEEAQAGLVGADEILHNVVRAAHNVILDDVGHTRHSPRFLTYLPRGLAVVIRVPYVDELRTVRALAERCAQDTSPKIQEQAGLLRAAADQPRPRRRQRRSRRPWSWRRPGRISSERSLPGRALGEPRGPRGPLPGACLWAVENGFFWREYLDNRKKKAPSRALSRSSMASYGSAVQVA
jgi:hypothetical protein